MQIKRRISMAFVFMAGNEWFGLDPIRAKNVGMVCLLRPEADGSDWISYNLQVLLVQYRDVM